MLQIVVADLTFARCRHLFTFFLQVTLPLLCFCTWQLGPLCFWQCFFSFIDGDIVTKTFGFEVTKDLKYPQQKYLIQTFCLNMTLCFYRAAVPRHQSASHHIGFSQACPARLGKQHFPANHLLRRKEAVIWLLLGPQVNTLVSLVFSKLWEGEERNLICKGQMEQWKLFPPKDNFGHFYSINFSYLVLIFFLHMPKICTKTEIECIKITPKATKEPSESLY